MTPWGEDAAAKKRMASVDHWANGRYNQNTKLSSTTINNAPIVGFKLTSSIRKGDYGAADKWRIEDPRGFELEITSSNLAELMSVTTIERGEILEKCVWARNGGNNVLLSVESDDYKEAVAMTAILNSSASWKDVKIGNEIILQNGTRGVFLGRYHCLVPSWRNHKSNINNSIQPKIGLRTYIKSTAPEYNPNNKFTNKLVIVSSPKLSSILSSNEITAKEAEMQINDAINTSTWQSSETIYAVAANPISDNSYTFELVQIDDTDSLDIRWDSPKQTYARHNNGDLVKIDTRTNQLMGTVVHEELLASGVLAVKTKASSRYGYSNYYEEQSQAINKSDISKYYRIQLCMSTKLGNDIRVNV
jgi:hypothetical protein